MHQLPRTLQLLSDARIGALMSTQKPAFVINGKGELVMTNGAGLSLLRVGSLPEASDAFAAVRGPVVAATRAVTESSNASEQLHSLPLPIAGSRRSVEFACSSIDFAGTPAVLFTGTEPSTSPADGFGAAAGALIDGDDEPLALFDAEGRRIHANAAAQALIGPAGSLNEIIPGANGAIARALADGSTELSFGVLRILLQRANTGGAPAVAAAIFGPSRPGAPAHNSAPQGTGRASHEAPAQERPAAAPAVQPQTQTAAPSSGAAGPTDAETQALAELLDTGSGEATRFAWETDAEGRFTSVSPELAAIVGEKRAAITGLHWRHAAVRVGITGGEAVTDAMAKHETWSGVTVNWPADERRMHPVEMAGLPVFDRERRFLGYRGFGVVRETAGSGGRGRQPSGDSDSEQEGDSRATGPITSPEPETTTSPAPSAADTASPAPPSGEPPALIDTRENVVRLRSPPATAELRPALTSGERNAFREIAKVIGSRLNLPEDEGAPSTATAPTAREEDKVSSQPLQAKESSERALLDRLPLGIAVHRAERVVFANRTLLDWIGVSDSGELAEAGGIQRLFSGVPALGVDEAGEAGRAIALRGRAGEPIPVEARLLSASWEGEAALVYVLRRMNAVIDRRLEESELALRDAEASVRELRAILDTATDGIALLDREGNVLGMNRSAEALFGFDSNDVEGRPFTDLFAPESHRAALDYLNGLAENGVASVLNDGREMIGRVREGGLIPLFMTLGKVGESQNKFCAVFRDITQWKRAEEELVHARREAERASSAKSDFLAKISHEIRTPLNAIIGFSEVMMEERFGPIGNERYVAYLKDIHASGEHMISLINDLLDLSKIEAGKLDLTFTSVDINEIASQCMAIMQPEANRERIIIRSALTQGLPPVVADARSIRQIVLNLLSNSIKFTQPGGQVIVSTTLTDDGELHLRVRDTGIGMSEAEIKTALEPFRQITTGGRAKAGGTGLGLPLTKALAEANRASFTIKSSVNAGSLVEIAFPPTRVLAG